MKTLAIIGVGALGSLIAEGLSRPDIYMYFFDDDTVEENNIRLSAYSKNHIGQEKTSALQQHLFDKYGDWHTGIAGTIRSIEDVTKWCKPDLIVDCLDNVTTRRIFHKTDIETLHVGVSVERHGEAVWDEFHSFPEISPERGEEVICTRNAGRPIIRMTATVAVKIIEEFLDDGTKRTVLVTEDKVI